MLTQEDIKNLTGYQKEVFATKDDIENLQKNFSSLQTSVDAIARNNKDETDKYKVLEHRVKKTENWIDEAVPKVGVKFDH